MSSGRFLLLQMAVLLAIGIFWADFVSVSSLSACLLLLTALFLAIAFGLLRRGWLAYFSFCLFFMLIGFLRAQLPDVSLLPPSLMALSDNLSSFVQLRIRQLSLQDDTISLLDAMLLGQREGIPDSLLQLYRRTGVAHVLALSGLHQGILFGGLNVLLLLVVNYRWRNLVGIFELFLIWGYALLTGFPLSLCRASLMLSIFVIGQIRLVGNDGWHTLGLAAFLLLLLSPSSLFDIGFQLSFAAVAGIFLFLPLLLALGQPRRTAWRWLWQAFLVSVGAQLGVFPLLLHYFNYVSLTGILLSPIYVLLTTGILYAALLLLVLAPLGLGLLFRHLLELLVSVQHGLMSLVLRMPLGGVEDFRLSWMSVLLLYAALLCLCPVLIALQPREPEVRYYRLAMFFRSWPYLLAIILLLSAVVFIG